MLHIHNGDLTANTMKRRDFPAEYFPFREALAIGPTPQGLSQDEWPSVRAKFLSEGSEMDANDVRRDLSVQDEKLTRASVSDEF